MIIAGAGLVGLAAAATLTGLGAAVDVAERQPDRRAAPPRPGRSVNLTLCTRGLQALDAVGVGDVVRSAAVPVYGRRIHDGSGGTEYQPYGNRRECLWSISRHRLWLILLEHAERTGVRVRFDDPCQSIDPDRGEVELSSGRRRADLVLAADGARSALRHQLVRRPLVEYSQHYSEHANKELRLPAAEARRAGLDPNALHIWPRGQLMLIVFPNPDGSMSATLHLPLEGEDSFAAIQDERALEDLFARHFADIRPLLPTLVEDYFSHPAIPMVTVRCTPTVFGRAALIGDAAHAMWPSYGQGANAGFEDCTVLAHCLAEGSEVDIPKALREYDAARRLNLEAIADLSERHFDEIRDRVGDPSFQARKGLERALNERWPDRYVPLYARIAFTTTPYAEAVRLEECQKRLVDQLLAAGTDVWGEVADPIVQTLMEGP